MNKFAVITKKELQALYKDHATAGIASMFGVNAETVRKRLVKLGIKRRKSGGRRDFDPSAKELPLNASPLARRADVARRRRIWQHPARQ